MKRTTATAALAVATVLPWALAAAPAQAAPAPPGESPAPRSVPVTAADHPGPHHSMRTDDDNPGGEVDFWPDGDIVRISDLQDDGATVQVTVRNETKDPDVGEYTRTFQGAGFGVEYRASMGQPYNLAEKHCFWFRIRLIKNGQVVSGSTDTAQWRNYNNTDKECPGVE